VATTRATCSSVAATTPEDGQPPAALLEELHLQRFGKLFQLQRHGGLREMQLLGGARDAAEPCYGFENDELRQQPMAKQTTRTNARHLGSLR